MVLGLKILVSAVQFRPRTPAFASKNQPIAIQSAESAESAESTKFGSAGTPAVHAPGRWRQ